MSKVYYRLLYLFIFFLVAYDAIYTFLPQSISVIIQWAAMILVAFSIPQYIKTQNKNAFITSLLLLLLLMFIGYFIVGAKASTFLKTCGFCILVPIPFMMGQIEPRYFKRNCLLLIILSLIMFFISINRIRAIDDEAYGGGYYALVTLPIGLYFLRDKSSLIKVLYSAFIFALVLFASKRGDIFACILSVLTFFMISSQENKKNRFAKFALTLLFLSVLGLVLFNVFLNNSVVFQNRYEQTMEGETNGRDIIYAKLWNYYLDSPIDKKIIGYGFDASQRIIGGSAHNDWLEILLGEGLVGAGLFLTMTLSMFFMVFRKSLPVEKRALLGSILAILLVKSFFSMFLFSMPTVVLFVLVGYLLNPYIKYE